MDEMAKLLLGHVDHPHPRHPFLDVLGSHSGVVHLYRLSTAVEFRVRFTALHGLGGGPQHKAIVCVRTVIGPCRQADCLAFLAHSGDATDCLQLRTPGSCGMRLFRSLLRADFGPFRAFFGIYKLLAVTYFSRMETW